jgi:hypothetical protein
MIYFHGANDAQRLLALKRSTHRLESFKNFQGTHKPLLLPRDIRMRCNSTSLMLVRAWDLRRSISGWLEKYGNADFQLRGLNFSQDDWQHVRYLIFLLRPFFSGQKDCQPRRHQL